MSQDSVSIKLDDAYALHVRSAYGPRAQVANSYRCPVGPHPGEAFVLLDRKNAVRLAERDTHTLTFDSTATDSKIEIVDLYWHSAVKLTRSASTDNSLYLTRLFDKRILACKYSDSETVLANIRGGAIAYDAPYVAGPDETWESLVTLLWPTILGDIPDLPYTPVGQPEGQWHGQSSWFAVHSVLNAIGCTTAYDPTTGEFSIVRRGETQEWDEPSFAIYDADPIGGKLDAPKTVAVYFPDWSEQHGTEPETLTDPNNYIEAPPYTRETIDTELTTVADTVKPVWSPFPKVSDLDGTDQNTSARTDWLDQEKENTELDAATLRRHKQFNGVHEILPGSEIKVVQWHHLGESGGMVTEYISRPGDPPRGGAGEPLDCFDSPTGPELNWQPPQFATSGYPTWPRTVQVIEVRHGDPATNGDDVEANADNVHAARLLYHDLDGVTSGEDVWLRLIDEYATDSGAVPAIEGGQFLARVCGMLESESEKRPLYVARKGGATESNYILYHGTLATQLTNPTTNASVTPVAAINSSLDVTTAISGNASCVNRVGGVGDSGRKAYVLWNRITDIHHLLSIECVLFESLVGLEVDEDNDLIKGHQKFISVMTWTQSAENSIPLIDLTDDCTGT